MTYVCTVRIRSVHISAVFQVRTLTTHIASKTNSIAPLESPLDGSCQVFQGIDKLHASTETNEGTTPQRTLYHPNPYRIAAN